MSFGKRLQEARKKANLSQKDVADALHTKSPVIGRYERDEAKPSIEVASKIADVLEVSLDYLLGKTSIHIDKANVKRLQDIEALSEEDRNHIFYALDNLIKAAKLKAI